ncbi:hypothetical protein ACJMK2_037918 [Sinanodonta woodiana]|uniref:Nucleolus and neural progenitor protein-like N-terminal domain-containing protein n=1 Tax=Sinanodonta woodiana TaxID=1069815 RepID=A0ABD3WQF5_SINWO
MPGQTTMWNIRHLKPPPACSLKTCLDWEQSHIIQKAYSAICKAEESVQNHKILWTENTLLESLVYKLNNQFRAEKFFQGLRKIRSCLKRFKEVDLEKLLSEIKPEFQIDPKMQVNRLEHLPSQQSVQYILVRIMSTTALLTQMANYCMYTFICSQMQLRIGSFIPQHLIFVSLVSRIWVICKSLCVSMGNLYNNLTSCLPALAKTEVSWLPEDEELPKDLLTWLEQVFPSPDEQEQDVTRQMQEIVEQRGRDDTNNEGQKIAHDEREKNRPVTKPEESSICTLEDIGEPVCRGKLKQRKKKRTLKTTADNYSQQIWTPSSNPSARDNTATLDRNNDCPNDKHVKNDCSTNHEESVIAYDTSIVNDEEPMIAIDTSIVNDEEPMIAIDTSLHSVKDRKQVHVPLDVNQIIDKISHSKKIGNFLTILRQLKPCLDKYCISNEQFKKCRKKIQILKKKNTQYIQRKKEYLELGRKYMSDLFYSQNCVDFRKDTFLSSCEDERQLENALDVGEEREEKISSPLSYYGDTIEKPSQTEASSLKRPNGKKSTKFEKSRHGGSMLCVTSDAAENQNKKRKRLVESLEVTELKNLYKGLKVKKNDDVCLQNFQFSMSKADKMQFKKKIGFYCKKLKAVKAGNDEELSVIMTKVKKYVNKFLNTKSLFITGNSDSVQTTTKQPAKEIMLSNKMTISQNKTTSDMKSKKGRKRKQT